MSDLVIERDKPAVIGRGVSTGVAAAALEHFIANHANLCHGQENGVIYEFTESSPVYVYQSKRVYGVRLVSMPSAQ